MDHSVLCDRTNEPASDRASGNEARLAVAASAVIKLISYDNLSDVRYLHAQCIRNLASGEFSDDELAACRDHVYSPKYVEGLSGAVGRRQFFGAWIGDALVGTAGWSTMEDSATVARIRSIFVSPLYTRLGLAHRLLSHVEAEATAAGFRIYSVRSMANATNFFIRQGYAVTSHGVRSLLPERNVPVTFLRKLMA
jgi:GNAT superfamily N-acetyltransferase